VTYSRACDRIDPIAHLCVAGHRTDCRIDEPAREFRNRFQLKLGVRIKCDDDASSCLDEASIERGRLATIGRRQQRHTRMGVEPLADGVGRAVGRAVINDDDFEIYIIAAKDTLDRGADDHGLVMSWDEN
jgi:hypothetical protein